jgi:hypothetical protein
MEWPLRDETTGKFRSTPTNQSIWLAAADVASNQTAAAAFRERVKGCKNWRNQYADILEDFYQLLATESPATAITMCQAGLNAAQQAFCFRVHNDETLSLEQAMARDWDKLKSKTHAGKKPAATADTATPAATRFSLASPHGSDAHPLLVTGDTAVQQLETWKQYGCMEPSAAEHAGAVCTLANVTSLIDNKTFCLLGLTSEMGPAHSLLRIPGAHVMGVARSESKMNKLVEWLEQEGAESTKLETLQADVLQQTPQIAQWIVETAPKDRELILLPLAYMDGEACVRVTVAMEAIVTHVMQHRRDVGLCYLISPAIGLAIPEEAVRDAKERYEKDKSWKKWLSMASLNQWYQPVETWKQLEDISDAASGSLTILNGLVNFQGPNYALAKTIQTWRCMVAHAAGVNVAAPLAPGTRTDSVLHSPEAAAFLEGLQYVPPMLAFDVWCCSSLMAAIVLHQLNNQSSDDEKSEHPLKLFWKGAVHGGSWRCPYTSESFGTVSYLLGKTIAKKGWCPAAALAPKPNTVSADDNV